jgi:hypothetical protein
MGIHTTYPRKKFALSRRIEMHDLTKGMHAGVGTTSAYGFYRVLAKFSECFFQHILHRFTVQLSLPALPRAAVVLKA